MALARRPHRLSPNQRVTMPSNLIFVDTETIPEANGAGDIAHRFRLGVAFYWRRRADHRRDREEWLRFLDPKTFWEWAVKKTRSRTITYLVSHNLAFDAMVLRMFQELSVRGWRILFVYEGDHTRLLKWGLPTPAFEQWIQEGKPRQEYKGRRWTQTIMAMDNANLFPGKLEAWGDALGVPKLPMPTGGADDRKWFTYCQRDVEIMVALWRDWIRFLQDRDLGAFRPTLAGQAWGAFRHRFMHRKIYLHNRRDVCELEREAYLGGRSEPFFVGKAEGSPVFQVDVNSMYPYVMARCAYPVELKDLGYRCDLHRLRVGLKYGGMIARVLVEVTEPIFPLREERRNVYPVGTFWTALTSNELRYALARGWVREVGDWAYYSTRHIFKEFVSYFYSLKVEFEKEGETLRRQMAKGILNSLYGKFGQRGYEDKRIGDCEANLFRVEYAKDLDSNESFTRYLVGGSVIESRRSGESYNSFPAICAEVTANARLYLWRLIQRAGWENTYYCDTDSLIVNGEGLLNLIPLLHPHRLGALKVEEWGEHLLIRGPKDYIIGGKEVRKGIPSKAVEVRPNVFQVETWPGLVSHLGRGELDTFHNKVILKELSYEVNWGELGEDGRVGPYRRGAGC